MKAARVSRETDAADLGIYGRLYEWAVWATDRQELVERHDDVAGDFTLTPRIRERILAARRAHYPPACEAVDRTVASMGKEHDEVMLKHLLRLYFIDWRTVENIAIAEDLSEFHVTEYLQRSMREVARRLPKFEQKGARC